MPLMHCMECHHEWESTTEESLCDWCGAAGYVLEEKTELEVMLHSHFGSRREPCQLPEGYEDPEDVCADAVKYRKMMNELCESSERVFTEHSEENISMTCPWCDGDGTDGHDRCDPPNPYTCQFCDGSGKVILTPGGDNA